MNIKLYKAEGILIFPLPCIIISVQDHKFQITKDGRTI